MAKVTKVFFLISTPSKKLILINYEVTVNQYIHLALAIQSMSAIYNSI